MSIEKKLILVLGMHRSGTSVLARMLNLLGVDLGANLIKAQTGVNDKGFWEHAEVVEINEALLSRLGSCWYDVRPLPDQWWQDIELDDLKDRAKHFLDTEFSVELALIKDPRLCLLLPFWQQVASGAGWSPIVVLANRHPNEVIASLCKRDPLSESTARLLWLRYVHDAEIHSRGSPRCLVGYQQLLEDWREVAHLISAGLDLQWPVQPQQVDSVINEEIDPGLRHQIAGDSEQTELLGLLSSRVYQAMPDLVGAQLDGLWQDFTRLSQSGDLLASTLLASNRRLMEVNNKLQRLGAAHRQALLVGDEHKRALKLLSRRDGQLKIANDRLKVIGVEHERALIQLDKYEMQLAKYERISQFPPIRMLVNGVRRSLRMLPSKSREH